MKGTSVFPHAVESTSCEAETKQRLINQEIEAEDAVEKIKEESWIFEAYNRDGFYVDLIKNSPNPKKIPFRRRPNRG